MTEQTTALGTVYHKGCKFNRDVTTYWQGADETTPRLITWHYRYGQALTFTFSERAA